MVKEKKEEKEEKTSRKKTSKKTKPIEDKNDVEKITISQFLEMNNIPALNAVGFLNYYGLSEDFKKEFETGKSVTEFSEEEFSNMYEKYIKREV